MGPWLLPALKFAGYKTLSQRTPVVHKALLLFRDMLIKLQGCAKNNFILIETQGSLQNPDYTLDWANELHPFHEGFEVFAGKFEDALRQKFPGRI